MNSYAYSIQKHETVIVARRAEREFEQHRLERLRDRLRAIMKKRKGPKLEPNFKVA